LGETLRRWLPRALGPLLLAILLWRADRAAIAAALARVQWGWLLAALALNPPVLLLRAWRWRLLLGGFAARLTYWEGAKIYALSVFAGAFTPGQAGELAKAWLVKRHRIPLGAALFSAVADRMLGLAFVALCAIGFCLFLLDEAWRLGALAVLAIGAAGALVGWRVGPAVAQWLRRWNRAARLLERVRGWLRHGGALTSRAWFPAAALTAVSWLLNWAGVYLAAQSLGLPISFAYLSGTMAFCALLGVLPISVMGLGTRDAALIFFLAPLGILAADALALSALILLLRLIYVGLCAGTPWGVQRMPESEEPSGK